MNISDVNIGDTLVVTHRPNWNGLCCKVTEAGTSMYPDMVVGIVTAAHRSQPQYPVGHSIKMFASRFEVFKKETTIKVGDLVEATPMGWEGLQYKVAVITDSGLVRGHVTITSRKKRKSYPVGTYVGFYPKSLKLVERDGKVIEKKSIFAKEGGWGP